MMILIVVPAAGSILSRLCSLLASLCVVLWILRHLNYMNLHRCVRLMSSHVVGQEADGGRDAAAGRV